MIEIKLNVKTVDIDDVIPNPWNANQFSDFMTEKLANTIERNGLVAEVIVREKGTKFEIIDGFHRWKELKEKGHYSITVNNLGTVSDDDAKLLGVALNELRGTSDVMKVVDVLMALQISGDWEAIRQVLPFTDKQLEDFFSFSSSLNADEVPFNDLVEGGVKKGESQEGLSGGEGWTDIKITVPVALKESVEKSFLALQERYQTDWSDGAQNRGAALKRMVEDEYAA